MTYKHLNDKQRFYIEMRRTDGVSMNAIAKELNISHSSISREIKRNTDPMFKGIYSHLRATNISKARRSKASNSRAFAMITEDILSHITNKISIHNSPEIISGELNLNNNIQISKNTIYRYLQFDRLNGGKIFKDLPHSGKPYRQTKSIDSNVKIIGRIGIEKRPSIADNKTEIGHTEIDTIFGKNQKSYLLTVVDKCSKFTIIRKLPDKCAETVVSAFKDIVSSTFTEFKTITSDNGLEFAFHKQISELTNSPFFFARPYRSCDRGLNEHTNGLIRRFFPKGTDFNLVSDEEVARVQFLLNSRGRKSLGFKSPNAVMLEYLQSGLSK